ncbi:unnamed protein product [Pleuronectes platessa]|uniref:Uncharacterized protein n=1 Tax=Pleuronectes platessa TaxID=8262 RepID=A0A9N7TZB0_PLEPL|nr:unnamed protein product [Pleuronectes platessa]
METALSVFTKPARTVWSEPVRKVRGLVRTADSAAAVHRHSRTPPRALLRQAPPPFSPASTLLIGRRGRGSPTPSTSLCRRRRLRHESIGSRASLHFIVGADPASPRNGHAEQRSCKRSVCTFQHQYRVDSSQTNRRTVLVC